MINRVRHCHIFSFVLLGLISFVLGCGTSSPVGSITIAASSSTIAVGATMQLRATDINFLHVTTDATNTATWSSTNPAILSVNSSGLVTGITPGYATIKAGFSGDSGGVVLTVVPATSSGGGGGGSLSVSPANATVYMGGAQQYSATAIAASGALKDVTSSTLWSALPAAVATITSTGRLMTVAPGSFTVTGVNNGQTATANGVVAAVTLSSIAITPATSSVASGSTEQLKAIGSYNDGSSRDLTTTVAWSSSNATALAVDKNGLASALSSNTAAATVTVTGTLGSVAGSASIDITSTVTLIDLVVQPTSSSIATGSAQQNTATAWYSDGTQKDVTKSVTWSSTSSNVTSVNSTGVNTADTPGWTTLTATLGTAKAARNANAHRASASPEAGASTMQSSSVVIVTPATVTSLAIRASRDLFPIGSTQPVQLIGTFSDSTTQDLSLTANWQSSNPAVATIDQTGLATGISAGNVVFSASFGGLTASTIGYQVLPSNLISLVITTAFPVAAIGTTQSPQVTGTYSDGTTHDLTQLATWKSSNPAVEPIDANGLATALSAGSAQITGTVGSLSAILDVVAFPVALSSIDVEPFKPFLALGTTVQMVANGNYANGVSTDISKPAVWRSENPAVLTIDSTGVVKAGSVGTTRVTATFAGVTQESSDITVTAAKPVTLFVVPFGPDSALASTGFQLAAFTGKHFVALALFNDGSFQEVTRDVNWNTSDNTTASIDTTGYIIGMKPGQVQMSASIGGVAVSVTVTVTGTTLQSVTVSPGGSMIPTLNSRQYTLTGNFADGTQQDLTQDAVWLSSSPLISGVLQQGKVLGLNPGVGEVAAQYGYFRASTPVTVNTAKLVSMALTPANSSIRELNFEQFVNTGTFDDGEQLNLSIGTVFNSGTPAVAQSVLIGVAFGRMIGTSVMSARYKGQTVTTNLTVTSNTPTSLTITPSNPNLLPGATQQFTANAVFDDGTSGDVSAALPFTTWTSSNPSVLNVNATGFATASTTNGTAVITAAFFTPAHGSTALIVTTASTTVTVGTGGSGGAGTGGGSGGGSGSATPTALQVTPTSAHLAAGTTKQLTATAAYADGTTQDISSLVTWTSTNPATATINSTGLVTAVRTGTVSVQAQVQGASGTLMSSSIVIVSGATLQSLAVSPSGAMFAAGSTQQFTLTGSYSDGTTQNLTSSADWSSSNAAVASISSTGLATGIASGSVQFTATYGGLTATSATNTVSPATLLAVIIAPSNPSFAKGTTQQFTLTGVYSDGTTRDLTSSATYTTSDPTVVSVTTSGLATAVGAGSAQVTASVGGRSATTQSVSVTPAVLSSITITPHVLSFAKGTTQQFTASGTFTDGTTQDLTNQAVWTSSDPEVVTIDQHGLATSGSVGSTQITAALNGITTSTGNVLVSPATLVGIALTPSSAQIAKGTSQQFSATGTFTDGTTQNLSSLVTWTSSNGNVVSVDMNGLATGAGVGSAQLAATYQGKAASTSNFGVTPATLVSLIFNPAQPAVAAGTLAQVSVLGRYSDGSTQDLTSTATFASSNTTVATVTSTGVVKGLQPGTATITVTAGGQISNFNVTVSAAVLTSLAITPASPPSLAKGTTEQFTATGTFSDGTTQNLTSAVTWTSSDTSVFSVSASGLATGAGVGSASLTAAFAGQTATTPTFQVTPATVASVAVTPQNVSIAAGGTQQFTAIATYTDSTMQNITSSVTWSSSNTAALSINSSGFSTASSTTTGANVALTAAYGSVTATNSVVVQPTGTAPTPPSPINLSVTPTSAHLAAGTTKQLTATGTFADGSTTDLTSSVIWTTTDSSIATVTASGLVVGVAPGTAGIQAQTQGANGSLTNSSIVIVSAATLQSLSISPSGANFAAGSTQQFTLTGTYSDGTTQNLSASANWSTSNAAVATISSTGLASSVAPGPVQFTASYGGQTVTSATNTVTPATLVSVSLTPASPNFAKGTTQQFSVIGTYSDGSTRDLTSSATYASSDPTVVSVSSAGLATGTGIGSAQVLVSVGGQSASTQSVTVTPAVLSSISITPQNASFAAGTSRQFTATGTFSDGTTQDLTTQTVWTSGNPQALTIDQYGLATGGTVGNAQITAALNGISATTNPINITPAVLTSVVISPTSAQIAKGTTQQLTATGTFSDGTMQNLSSTVSWSSSNGQVVSIDGSGLATGTGVGSAQLTASYMGQSSSTTSFAVTPATLISISFNPANPTVASGTSSTITVLGLYSDGTTQDLTSSASLNSSNTAVATVGSNGIVNGRLPGTSVITVTAGGQTNSFNVNVSVAILTSLTISPSTPSAMAKGTTQQFTAAGTFSDGSTQNLSSTVTWTSSSTSVVTIDGNGLATAVQVGSASVSAAYNGQTATTSTFQVTPANVASIAVTPQAESLTVGMTQQYGATATYTDGTTADVSSSVVWSSSNTSAATVNASGLATAVAAGSTTIAAQLGSKSGTSTLTATGASVPTLQQIIVVPASSSSSHARAGTNASPHSALPGSTQQFIATGVYSDQSTHDLTTQVAWSSSVLSVATINSTGLASAVSAGTTSIQAQLSGLSGSVNFTVTAPAVTLQSITVTPSAASVAKGNTQQFTAAGLYSDGTTQTITTQVTWQSSVPAVATIATTGLATSVNGGNTQISATLSGQTAVSTLTVSPATLVSLAVTPQTASVASGTTQQYRAIGTLSDGSTQDLTTSVTWSSSSSSLATINASGLATTAGTGTDTITATAGSTTNSATLTITTATVTGLQVTPSPLSLPAGSTQQLLVTATFSDGSSQNVTSAATYSSSNSSVVTVDANGNVHAVGPGTATVTITLNGATTTLTVTIGNATVTSLAITPQNPTLAAGQSQQLTATATYTDGSTQNLTSSVTWTTSNSNVATVSPTGNVIVAQAGTTTITATASGISATDTITGTAAVATAISVSPASATLAAGQTQQFAATASMSDGTQQTLTTSVHWSVSDPSKASVSNSSGANGLLTANSAGSLNVVAALNGVSGSAAVTITAATLSSLTINPSAVISLPAGTNKQLSVTGAYSDGSSADVTSQVIWTSSQASTAYVDASALLHAVSSGLTTINAVLSGVTGTAAVTVGNATLSSIAITPAAPVLALGQTTQLTATGTYSDGSTANITSQVQWNSGTPAVATVSSAGLVTTLATGTSNLSATLNGVSQSTPLTVTSATLQSISVQVANSGPSSFALGTSLQLKAIGIYSDGTTQNLTSTVTWSSSAPTVGVVSSTGLATGVTPGTFNAKATSNGITGSTPITVTAARLVSLAITPANTIVVNLSSTRVQFTATGTFSDGSTQDLTTSVHWGTAGITVGSISTTGVFTPTSVGLGQVTATLGAISATTGLTVVSLPLF